MGSEFISGRGMKIVVLSCDEDENIFFVVGQGNSGVVNLI